MANPFIPGKFSATRQYICRCMYAVGFIGYMVLQLIYKDFYALLIPQWPAWLPGKAAWAIITAVLIIAACICLLFDKVARTAAITMGIAMFLFVACFHLPYHISAIPEPFINWADVFEGISFAGAFFILAAALPPYNDNLNKRITRLLPLWRFCLCFVFILFGVFHFVYADYTSSLVPKWIPGAYPWTYFAGIALILGGIGMIFNIMGHLASNLMGIMILAWLFILHIQRAIADPNTGEGFEVGRVFATIAYPGICFLLAGMMGKKPGDKANYVFDKADSRDQTNLSQPKIS